MGLYWEPCPGGARLLRLLGDTPCPAVPGTIEGLPVAELGPYCFADRPVRPGARRTGDDTHEITGNFVEEVTLPDTVRVLDSAAFYNCRRLRRVTLGPGVEGFGSDLFTNCRQLQTFRLRAAADAPTGLKKLLGAVSADITVELDGAQLFYPEYSEFLDENTPAHIFNHSIEGEGYRMRQCFTPGGAVAPGLTSAGPRPAAGRSISRRTGASIPRRWVMPRGPRRGQRPAMPIRPARNTPPGLLCGSACRCLLPT